MIDEEATFEKFGYYTRDLKPNSDKKIIVICDGCGKIREITKKSTGALCRSCSQKGKVLSETHKRKISTALRKGCEGICENCGSKFKTTLSRTEEGKGKYCSRKCAGIARSKKFIGENNPSWKGGKIKCVCIICGKDFYREPSHIKKGRRKVLFYFLFCQSATAQSSPTKD